jgi:polyisoprenoid-binding protein YceI
MRPLAVILAGLALLGVARADVSADPRRAPSGSYGLEIRHSQVLWGITHLGITDFYGRFEKLTGSLNFNATAPEKSSVKITIQMASLTTPNAPLISELAGPSVFNAGKFPTATFESTSVERTGPTTGKITGNLTLHGVTKPVTLETTFGGSINDPITSNADLGFHATATIKRSDFGLTGMAWESFVSDDVKLIIEAMFIQQKS